VKKTPEYDTDEQIPVTARGEVRIPLRQFPLWKFRYQLGYIPGDASEDNSVYCEIINFFMSLQGSGQHFLFKDPYDFTVTNQNIGYGDGSTVAFTMYRTMGQLAGGPDLIQNFINPPSIYVDGTLQTVTTDYSIDQYGTLTFTAGHIPASTKAITWTGTFYFLCHFDKDSFDDMEEVMYQIWKIGTFSFTSSLQ